MKEAVQQFIPLPQARTERVSLSLALPQWIDTNFLGINVRGIETICNLSGLRSIVIAGSSDGKTSHSIPQTVGFNNQGGAYAARSQATTMIPLSEGRFSYDPCQTLLPRYARWADAQVELNMNEISQRVQKSDDIRSVQNWVKPLNDAIRDGVFEAANKHLDEDMDLEERIIFLGPTLLMSALAYLQYPKIEFAIISLIVGVVSGTIVRHVLDYIRYLVVSKQQGFEKGAYRWSIYPHRPVDRIASLSTLAFLTSYVKKLD